MVSRLVVFVVMGALTCASAMAQDERQAAKLYWGGYRHMDQLVEDSAKWDFVREHMDGFVLHFGYWLNNDFNEDPIAVGRKLAPMLKDKQVILEVGWPSAKMPPESLADMGTFRGTEFARKIRTFEQETGIGVNELSAELRLFVFKQVAAGFPEFSQEQVWNKVLGPGGYWANYVALTNRELPHIQINLTCPPIYLPWDGLWFASNDFEFVPEGRDESAKMRFEGKAMFDAVFNGNTNTIGYIADSPHFLMSNQAYIDRGYFKKLLGIQEYLRERGLQFSFIVNGPSDKELSGEAWDKQYAYRSLRALQIFQSFGGRADKYLMESWYDGPFRVVPEDEPGTYTHHVAEVIRYIRGPGQTLDLASEPLEGGRWSLRLTNTGDVQCMPQLALVGGHSGDGLAATLNGRNVTAALRSRDGLTISQMLKPGEAVALEVSANMAVEFAAYWNPQDGQPPRARVQLKPD